MSSQSDKKDVRIFLMTTTSSLLSFPTLIEIIRNDRIWLADNKTDFLLLSKFPTSMCTRFSFHLSSSALSFSLSLVLPWRDYWFLRFLSRACLSLSAFLPSLLIPTLSRSYLFLCYTYYYRGFRTLMYTCLFIYLISYQIILKLIYWARKVSCNSCFKSC